MPPELHHLTVSQKARSTAVGNVVIHWNRRGKSLGSGRFVALSNFYIP